MAQAESFPFVVADPAFGEASRLPYLPITLRLQDRSITVSSLLDTGSAVNVLPHEVGLQLGAVWEHQTTSVRLTGNLANEPARVLTLMGSVVNLPSVRLVFAWTRVTGVPVILGQVNFFIEFDVCFYRSRSIFEVKVKSAIQAWRLAQAAEHGRAGALRYRSNAVRGNELKYGVWYLGS